MHGLGGFKERPMVATFAKASRNNGYTVVRFDSTNSCGESDGNYEDATVTNYYEDLEDVINWAKTQSWYQEPFCLAGSSMGGLCVGFYAENNPTKVRVLALISSMVSGKLSLEMYTPEQLKDWEESGWQIRESTTVPGQVRKLPWSHAVDRLKYDLLPKADQLTMPVLMLVGDSDKIVSPAHQQMLFNKLSGPKEMHIIKGGDHDFNGHLEEVGGRFDQWIDGLK
ncbi:MAG: alpha/beta fold hydrolase [Patescibacteria group bacterium]